MTLEGVRILVVEDEYLIAQDLVEALDALGAEVVGPVPSLGRALALLDAGTELDGAVLDINLQGDTVFPVADRLIARNIPFLFATGYDEDVIPRGYAGVPRCEKPLSGAQLERALAPHFANSR